MSRWTEDFQAHPIHATLTELTELVKNNTEEVIGDTAEIRRFIKVISRIQESLSHIDPELVSSIELDQLNASLQASSIKNQVVAFTQNNNADHISTVNNNLNSILVNKSWLVSDSNKENSSLNIEQLELICDKLENKFQKMAQNIAELEKEKSTLEETIKTRRTEVDGQMTQWLKQFSDAQEKRISDYSEWKDKIKEELELENTKFVNETEAQLNKFNQEKEKEISDLKQNTEQEVNVIKKNVEQEFLTLKQSIEQQTDELITNSTKKHERIQELYQLASDDSITGGYAKTANDEDKQANKWRDRSLAFIIFAVSWLMFVCFINFGIINIGIIKESLSWVNILFPIPTTLVLLYGAIYSSQQSTRHRDESKRTKRLELQIKALDPYISSLAPAEQLKIKQTLVDRFFIGVETLETKEEAQLSDKLMSQIVKLSESFKGK